MSSASASCKANCCEDLKSPRDLTSLNDGWISCLYMLLWHTHYYYTTSCFVSQIHNKNESLYYLENKYFVDQSELELTCVFESCSVVIPHVHSLCLGMCDSTGERLKGSEAELAGAVGAVGMEEGDSD